MRRRHGGSAPTATTDADEAPATASLRQLRQQLVQAVLAGSLPASELPAAYATAADDWLARRFATACGGREEGLALVAVGGYGAGALAPGSDLDLLLLHQRRRGHEQVARQLWYAVWDDGSKLDHSLRSPRQALEVARSDLRALLGLLDSRCIAGARPVHERLLGELTAHWRAALPALLPELEASVAARHEAAGELAFLLEPDLKQSAGGLRDLALLRAFAKALPATAELLASRQLAEAERTVLATRVALQCLAGSSERLVLQEQDRVARLLGLSDADAVMAALARAARAVTAAAQAAWREANAFAHRSSGRPAPTARPAATGVLVAGDEALLAPDADLADPALVLRLARIAAEQGLAIAPGVLDQLRSSAGPPARPWQREVREHFLAVLGAGPHAVGVLEALDHAGLLEWYLPEWAVVRNKPQRNAYHRYTVDRHLLEAAARAATLAGRVARPDLLLAGALLHDLGKGYPGDHSSSGAELAEEIARRMGFPDPDVTVLGRLVRFHLLLPEVATRRDLEDPMTAQIVAWLVEDGETLELLAALTEADGIATGPTAWGAWKAELVRTLVERTGRVLAGEHVPDPPPLTPAPGQRLAIAERRLEVSVLGNTVSVVAPDRHGLLAAAAGVLALNGCNVRRARAGPASDGMALEEFHVELAFDRHPDPARVQRELEAALEGSLQLEQRLASQDRAYAGAPLRRAGRWGSANVTIDNLASQRYSVVEVRAPDRFGLLYRITSTLAALGLDVASALVDTLGQDVVDAFYVEEPGSGKIERPERMSQVRGALERALAEDPAG